MAFQFNQGAGAGAGQGKSLFGSNPNSPAATGGIFGNVGATPTTSTSSPAAFGAVTSGAGQSTSPFSFGGLPQAQNKDTPGQPSIPSLLGPSQTPKPADAGQTKPQSLFGEAPKSGTGTASSPFGSATPTTSGGFNFAKSSTTPAGQPPAISSGQPSLFGAGQPSQKPFGTPFGTPATTGTSTPAASGAPTSTSALSLTGGTSQVAPGTSLFGNKGTSDTPKSSMFGNAPAGGGLFGGANKQAEQSQQPAPSSKPATQQGLFSPAPTQPSSLFSGAPASTTSQSPSKLAFSGFNLPKAGETPATQTPITTATTSETPQKSMFPSLGGASSATPSSTPAAAPSGGLFGGAKTTASTTPGTAAPAATSQPASGGLFASVGKPATPSTSQPASATTPSATTAVPAAAATSTTATTSIPTTTAAPAASGTAGTGAPNLGASTAGPVPPSQSRLKNKTMDEIITRWATDLTKYQKEFQEQANKVAEWDRMLVENGNRVQKLYGNTVDAERATQEVERQLASVEGQQDELSAWLDRYEREVDEMMSKQVGSGDSMQGPDQERERTFKLGEKLSERLEDMGKDLGSMIEEVNGVSATLSKTTKADEPITQIVRILNSHLSQLQLIDQGTATLQAKVAEAQKSSRNLGASMGAYGNGSGNGYLSSSRHGQAGGVGGTAADDFYRSYMGRR